VRILVTVPWGRRLGGAEALLHTLVQGAGDAGHEMEFAFLEAGSWPDELARGGFRVDVIEAGRLRDLRRAAAVVRELRRIIAAREPDLILNWASKTQVYGSLAAVPAGMADRVVWWQHAVPTRNRLDVFATLLPAVGVLCSSSAGATAQARLFPARPTFVVHAGAPPAPADEEPAALPLPDGIPVVGLVGRLQPWKGQDRLLAAQALLRERGHEIHVLLVGGDAYGLSPEYANALPALAERLGLSGSVTMTGEVADAGPYIHLMDVLVNASDPEPFGIVLLEGMARKVPVVAVDSGGPAEVIEHERTGLLAPSGEPVALADALERVLLSPALGERLGQAGYEHFTREYTDVAARRRFFARLEEIERRRRSSK
jgi:glycosyltransferase involved in cell wall biosynthesis